MTAVATARQSITLGEYQRKRVDAAAPTDADLILAERLMNRDDSARLEVRWLADRTLDVASFSWVGVVRFSHVEIRVLPKLVGEPLRVLRMLEYATGVNMLRRLPSERPLPANGDDLFDLICLLLVQEIDVLIRDGLLRDYRAVDDTFEVLRGRLRYREQFLRRFGQLDRLECHYDEYDGDTPTNQLLAAALEVARPRVRDDEIRFSVARHGATLSEVCQPTHRDAASFERSIHYNRRTERYRPAHELSKLVLRGAAFGDLFEASGRDVCAFLLDMNVVFERFVTRLVTDALHDSGLDASRQHPLRAVVRNDDTSRSYTTLTPDLVITDPQSARSVPIDIKYKTYETRHVSTSDIYQTFLYAYALGDDHEERRAGILYPAARATNGPNLSIKPITGPSSARIVGRGIDVRATLDQLGTPAQPELFRTVRSFIEHMTGFVVAERSA